MSRVKVCDFCLKRAPVTEGRDWVLVTMAKDRPSDDGDSVACYDLCAECVEVFKNMFIEETECE